MTETTLPQPQEISIREKEDAMGAYLMMFASVAVGLPLPIINLVAAVVYYYINRSKSKFVHFHSLQSLLSQLPTSILNGVAVIWTVRNFFVYDDFSQNYWGFIIMVGIANLLYFIFSIIAAYHARKGHFYYFIFFGKIAFQQVYLKNSSQESEHYNQPPKL